MSIDSVWTRHELKVNKKVLSYKYISRYLEILVLFDLFFSIQLREAYTLFD